MRTFRWLVAGAAAALVLNVGSTAADNAAPDYTVPSNACFRTGGASFSLNHDPGSEHTGYYTCFGNPGTFSPGELGAARGQCLGTFKGRFTVNTDGTDPGYVCSGVYLP